MCIPTNNFYIEIQERCFFVPSICFIQLKVSWIYISGIYSANSGLSMVNQSQDIEMNSWTYLWGQNVLISGESLAPRQFEDHSLHDLINEMTISLALTFDNLVKLFLWALHLHKNALWMHGEFCIVHGIEKIPILIPNWCRFSLYLFWYVMERFKSLLRKFYGRYGDLVKLFEVPLSQMLNDIL